MPKIRLDVFLVEHKDFKSREESKRTIMAGLVYVDGQMVDKAGTMIKEDAEVTVKEKLCPYVSRGGLKLEKALEYFNIDLNEKICCDMGASTGGFTDCMLSNGSRKVYAIDVGYGQLDYKLRNNSKVVNLEKTNIRYLDENTIKDKIHFISIDVSFISLKLILPVAKKMLEYKGKIVCLVKPQFEAGKQDVGKNGIVRDPQIQKRVLEEITIFGLSIGLKLVDLVGGFDRFGNDLFFLVPDRLIGTKFVRRSLTQFD